MTVIYKFVTRSCYRELQYKTTFVLDVQILNYDGAR